MTKSSKSIFNKPDLDISDGEIILFGNVRNEESRLPHFFSYYRNLGVDRFFIVDNRSTDNTADVIRAQPDAHYFHTDLPYAAAAGRNWTTELAAHYGMGHWCLVADADELFVFPGVEFISIRDLVGYLDECQYAGTFGVFLDMYYPGKLDEARYVSGTPFLNTCSWFDTDSYWLDVAKLFPRVDISGGPRWRKFWADEKGEPGPTMRKHILVKWQPGFQYRFSTHSMAPIQLADFTTAVLHFKFFSSFSHLAEQEHGRGDRFRPDHYAIYKDAAAKEGVLDFSYSGGSKYKNSATLVRNGYLNVPDRYAEFMRRVVNERASASNARYKAAVQGGVATELQASLSDFVAELVSAAGEAQAANRISLNQFCCLWPLLTATLDSMQTVSHNVQNRPAQASSQAMGHQRQAGIAERSEAHRKHVGEARAIQEKSKAQGKELDLTVCVTAQSETAIAGPTVSSCELAVRAAEAKGFRIERLIALDAATADCRAFFAQQDYSNWKIFEFDYCDVGLTRNAIAEMAHGRWISFLDADDLFSENWLLEGMRALRDAEADGRRVIVHPEINWVFDRLASVFTKPDQRDPIFTPYFFQVRNYYDSLFMAPRRAYREIPFVHRDVPNGLSFQDWQFAIESMAAGWEHVCVRDTVIFKRRRDSSLVTESSSRKALIRQLPPMAIDQIGKLGLR